MKIKILISELADEEVLVLDSMLVRLNQSPFRAPDAKIYGSMAEKFEEEIAAQVANHAAALKHDRIAALAPLGEALALLPRTERRAVVTDLIAKADAAKIDTTVLRQYLERDKGQPILGEARR